MRSLDRSSLSLSLSSISVAGWAAACTGYSTGGCRATTCLFLPLSSSWLQEQRFFAHNWPIIIIIIGPFYCAVVASLSLSLFASSFGLGKSMHRVWSSMPLLLPLRCYKCINYEPTNQSNDSTTTTWSASNITLIVQLVISFTTRCNLMEIRFRISWKELIRK